jgi:hypothetical protein
LILTDVAFRNSDFKSLQAQSNRHAARFGLALGLAFFAGLLAQDHMPGSVIALIPLAILVALALRQFSVWWTAKALLALLISITALTAVIIEPGPLNLTVMWLALAAFALQQQGAALTNLYTLLAASLQKLFAVPMLLLRDAETFKAVRTQLQAHKHILTLANALLPLVAVVIFGALLMQANPLIENLAYQLSWGNPAHFLTSYAPFVMAVTFALIWCLLRLNFRPEDYIVLANNKIWAARFLAVSTVAITLILLNAMFLLETVLDYKYIWTGQALPPGMNYAEYVHRGSYTLIATAILAGAFVSFILQPNSETAKSPLLRWLVYAWVLQNLALVFSSSLRTLAYVDAYGMSLWRMAGLIWMGVVAAGLMWTVLRIVMKRGHLWLVNVNLATTFCVLLVCGFVNFSAVVAEWNVARALASPLHIIDMSYLESLGPSALPAVRRLQASTTLPLAFSGTSSLLEGELHEAQSDWQRWTVRGIWLGQEPQGFIRLEERQ